MLNTHSHSPTSFLTMVFGFFNLSPPLLHASTNNKNNNSSFYLFNLVCCGTFLKRKFGQCGLKIFALITTIIVIKMMALQCDGIMWRLKIHFSSFRKWQVTRVNCAKSPATNKTCSNGNTVMLLLMIKNRRFNIFHGSQLRFYCVCNEI